MLRYVCLQTVSMQAFMYESMKWFLLCYFIHILHLNAFIAKTFLWGGTILQSLFWENKKSWKHMMEAECMAYDHFFLRFTLAFSLKLFIHCWAWLQPSLAFFRHLAPVWLREAHARAKKMGVTEWWPEAPFFRYLHQS